MTSTILNVVAEALARLDEEFFLCAGSVFSV